MDLNEGDTGDDVVYGQRLSQYYSQRLSQYYGTLSPSKSPPRPSGVPPPPSGARAYSTRDRSISRDAVQDEEEKQAQAEGETDELFPPPDQVRRLSYNVGQALPAFPTQFRKLPVSRPD